jgi:hypothetical protein
VGPHRYSTWFEATHPLRLGLLGMPVRTVCSYAHILGRYEHTGGTGYRRRGSASHSRGPRVWQRIAATCAANPSAAGSSGLPAAAYTQASAP